MITMAHTWQPAADTLTRDLAGVFRDRLLSVVVYGGQVDSNPAAALHSLALVSSLTADDLGACAQLISEWTRGGIATPLILPDAEFRATLDVFPLEYGEIVRAHVLVYGANPFTDVVLSQRDLRLACEAQAMSHLLHLRQGYIQTGGRLPAVARLVAQSAPAFAALLRNVGRLSGVQSTDRMDATRQGATTAGLPMTTVDAILALETPSALPASDPARLFPDYLRAVEHLAAVVDQWRVS